MDDIVEGTLGRVLANEATLDLLVNLVLAESPHQASTFIESLEKIEQRAALALVESPFAAEAFAKRVATLRALAADR